jgi:hypothetical protein
VGLDIVGIGSIFDFGSKVIDKIFPDKNEAEKAKLAMLQLQQAGDFKELEGTIELAKAQLEINREEAKNPNVFVSGWRPATGWTCVLGLFYATIVNPILTWMSINVGWQKPPTVDTVVLFELLCVLLGVGGLRTLEKFKKVASK